MKKHNYKSTNQPKEAETLPLFEDKPTQAASQSPPAREPKLPATEPTLTESSPLQEKSTNQPEEAETLPLFEDAPTQAASQSPPAREPKLPATEPTLTESSPLQENESPVTELSQTGTPTSTARSVTPEERKRILHLHDTAGLGTRAIAKAIGRGRKAIQQVLRGEGRLAVSPTTQSGSAKSDKASKLDGFRNEIKDRVAKGFTVTRILREIRELGYQGGRSILSDYAREIRAPLAPRRKVTRRFETPAGQEAQVDWSTYRVLIGGVLTVVQVLGVVLAHSRRSFLWATNSQRLERLLEGLALAFEHFKGVTLEVVFDNMATVSLGRVGRDRKPIWNDGFLPFAGHYGFKPVLCQIAHPDRKGEVEAILGYFERDCLLGLEPESFADLNRAIYRWNDEIANKRVHGTTRRVPDEAWAEERPFLIALPERRYAGACVEEVRLVAEDCTVSILGTLYTVPARLAHRRVRVRLYSERFEVLDRDGQIALARAYVPPSEKGRLVLDPTHYEGLPRRGSAGYKSGTNRRLKEQLLRRWPSLGEFLAGLQRHVKGLIHVHMRRLLRAAERYGDEAVAQAASTAHEAGLHTAQAVERILAASYEEVADLDPIVPLGAERRANALLGEVESGTLEDYAHLDDVSPADEAPSDDVSPADEAPSDDVSPADEAPSDDVEGGAPRG